MYQTFDDYYQWKNLKLPVDSDGNIKGKKFFMCDIPNNFKFTYWVFIPTELNKK